MHVYEKERSCWSRLEDPFLSLLPGLPCLSLQRQYGLRLPRILSISISKYIDEAGTPTFTDQWESIPERYRSRVEVINPQTVRPPPSRPDLPAHQQPEIPAAPHGLEPWKIWLSGPPFPRLGRVQIAVGLLTVVLVIGVGVMIRFSPSPLLKVLFKLLIVLLLGSCFYIVSLSNLNERLSAPTGAADPSPLARTSSSPLLDTLQHVHQRAIGRAERTRQEANRAAEQRRKMLEQADPATDVAAP